MTWIQKLLAMKAICPGVSIQISESGDFYVLTPGVDRRERNTLSRGGHFGKSPEEAVENVWQWATDRQFYLVLNALNDRRAVRWNGFMWAAVKEEE